MDFFINDSMLTEGQDSTAPGWLTALGILLLVGTVFQEIVGISL